MRYSCFGLVTCILFIFTHVCLAATVTYQYDDLGRLAYVSFDESTSITYTYDNAGNQLTVVTRGLIQEQPVINDAGDFSLGNTLLQVYVPVYGEEYGTLSYELAVGTSECGTEVSDWTAYGADSEGLVTLDNLNLSYGQEYYVSVRILNSLGTVISRTGCSDGVTVLDPVVDSDVDGFNNQAEVESGSHPLDQYSYPGETHVALDEGFNFISIPEDIRTKSDLRDWLPVIGNSSEIDKVMMFDSNAGGFVSLVPEDESNPAAPILGGEGIIIHANQKVEVTFSTIFCPQFDLKQGINVIGIACPTVSSTAFQLLDGLGVENAVSIQRFSKEKGAFESAGFDANNQPSGINFPIVPGEGYFVYMKTDMNNVRF